MGELTDAVSEIIGYRCKVVLPAAHDTASAILAMPSTDPDTVYISSGTWSLLGVELDAPDCGDSSRRNNFTNEGGFGGKTCYLKNIMGLWMIQSLRKELLDRFPGELSGGQQQRVSIARAISLMPRLLVLDEPTSALDVSVQAQTLNELLRLQKELNMTYIFITHNLSVVRYMSDRICVMYGGKVMEIGKTEDIYDDCLHPYTLGLMSSVPPLHPRERERKKYLLTGDMPSLIDVGEGCRFCSRCSFRKDICESTQPQLKDMGDGHYVACHFAGEINF